jgi:excisionase family DNA binding protein
MPNVNPKPALPQPELVSREAAAIILGISVQMIDKMIRLGTLPHVPIGRRVLIRRSTLDLMMQEVKACN